MAMLAEKRSKVRYVLNPRSNQWSQDTSKFGHRLMEKMGWKPGNGLGLNQQGSTEHVKVTVRSDNRGVGFKGVPEDILPHQNDFSNLLEQLISSEDQPTASSKSGSLEKKSQQSRSRLHYHRSTRGKDLSRYSEQDLACILGKQTSQPLEQAVYHETQEAKEHLEDSTKKQVKDSSTESDLCSDEGKSVPDKPSMRKKKTRDGDSSNDLPEDEEIDGDVRMTKKQKKREKRKQAEAETIVESEDVACKKRKKRKQADSEIEIEREFETEDSECKKKKKRKQIDVDILEESEGAKCKSEKKEKKVELEMETEKEEVDTQSKETEAETVKDAEVSKKRKKKKKHTESENKSDVEAETVEKEVEKEVEEDGDICKKKKKRKHSTKETDIETQESECTKEKNELPELETPVNAEVNTEGRKNEKSRKQGGDQVSEEVARETEEEVGGSRCEKVATKRRKSVTFSDELFHVVIIPPREDVDFDIDDDNDDDDNVKDAVVLEGVKYVNGIRVNRKPNGRQLIESTSYSKIPEEYGTDDIFEGFPGSNVAQFGYAGLEYKF